MSTGSTLRRRLGRLVIVAGASWLFWLAGCAVADQQESEVPADPASGDPPAIVLHVDVDMPDRTLGRDEVLEARLTLELEGEGKHAVAVLWNNGAGRLVHRDDLRVNARFGRQEFRLRFWLTGGPDEIVRSARVDDGWAVTVLVDGALAERARFSVDG